jgi:hypothetical protein
MERTMSIFKKAVRLVGIEPESSSTKVKKDGSVDQRGQRGPSRTPAQKTGDSKRRGPRKGG